MFPQNKRQRERKRERAKVREISKGWGKKEKRKCALTFWQQLSEGPHILNWYCLPNISVAVNMNLSRLIDSLQLWIHIIGDKICPSHSVYHKEMNVAMMNLPIIICMAISEELFIYAGWLKVIYLLNQNFGNMGN